jgi:peptidoglycan hydrolase-like protein with peptidoglycan-binding domain
LLYDPPTVIASAVGNGFENRRRDVASVQRRLGALGYLSEDPFDRPHGFIDEPTTKAITRFQTDNNLTPDGWLAPRGDTERALEDAVLDLARVRGRDWFNFADRAARAQTGFVKTLELRKERTKEDGGWLGETLEYRPDTEADLHVVPVQGRGVPGAWPRPLPPIVPIPGEQPELDDVPGSPRRALQFLWERILRRASPGADRQADSWPRKDIDEDEKSGGRLENIHPPIPREPYGGLDPARPPLSPELAAPSPYPSDRPQLPNKTENIPLRPKRGDHIIVLPDPSDVIGRQPIIIENRQGTPPTKALNRGLGAPVIEIGKGIFGEGNIKQIGGPTPDEGKQYKEFFGQFIYKKQFGITSNASGSFEDVTYVIKHRGAKV